VPLIDVELIGPPARPQGLAQRLADATGDALQTDQGRTWVRVRTLPADAYAENHAPPQRPVFATVVLRALPPRPERDHVVVALTRAIAGATDRLPERVHVRLEPAAAGRQAFGGRLVEG